MGSRKKLALSALVSTVLVLSFAIGMMPAHLEDRGHTARAALGGEGIAISVDGQSPVGESFAIPVGGEQGFSAISLADGRLLPPGEVEWSLATDGAAELDVEPGSSIATVSALRVGAAGLYVSTPDGASDVVELDLTSLKAAGTGAKAVEAVTITSPRDGATIFHHDGRSSAAFGVTSWVDSPEDLESLVYTFSMDGQTQELEGGARAPYLGLISNISRVDGNEISVTANGAVEASSSFSFSSSDADTTGNGLPDDPFGLGMSPGDLWISEIDEDGEFFLQTVGAALSNGGDKLAGLTEDGVTVALDNIIVTVPEGLLEEGEEGIVFVNASGVLADLVGEDQAALMGDPPAESLVSGGQFLEISIIVSDDGGETFGSLPQERLQDNPVLLTMTDLAIAPFENARFFSYPSAITGGEGGAAIEVVADEAWLANEAGTLVDDARMSARLHSLSVFAPFETPEHLNITGVFNDDETHPLYNTPQDYSIGGATIAIYVDNLPADVEPVVTIDGNAAAVLEVEALEDENGAANGHVIRVEAPEANPLDAPAASNAVDISIEAELDNGNGAHTVPAGFTYRGPDIEQVIPAQATTEGGDAVTLTGAGFGTLSSVELGEAALDNVAAENESEVSGVTPATEQTGSVDVSVVLANNFVGTVQGGFTFVEAGAPFIDSVIPESVFTDGGYRVNVNGQNFSEASEVYFISDIEGDFNVSIDRWMEDSQYVGSINDTERIEFITPEHPAAEGGVYVWDPMKQTEAMYSNIHPFAFIDAALAAMVVYEVDPAQGAMAGGDTVTIEVGEEGLTAGDVSTENAPVIYFGANQAAVENATAGEREGAPIWVLEVVTPTGDRPGPVDVRAEDAADPSRFGILRDGFTYDEEAVEPDAGWIFGGQVSTVKGSGFTEDSEVFFGDQAAERAPGEHTDTEIRVIVPPYDVNGEPLDQDAFAVDVRVEDPSFDEPQTFENGFTYVRYLTAIEPRDLGDGSSVEGEVFTTALHFQGEDSGPVYLGEDQAAENVWGELGLPAHEREVIPEIPDDEFEEISEGNVLRMGNEPIFVDEGEQITVPVYLFRAEDADQAPATMNFALRYDPSVLEFASAVRTAELRTWYGHSVTARSPASATEPTPEGFAAFVISNPEGIPITTVEEFGIIDPDTEVRGEPTNEVLNPFPMVNLTFNVVGSENDQTTIEEPSQAELQELNVSPMSMADSAANAIPNAFYQGGLVRVGEPAEEPEPILVDDLFVMVRASLEPQLFALDEITTGTPVSGAWNFDLHLYDSMYPFDELDLTVNTGEVPGMLTYPVGGANIGQAVADGRVSTYNIATLVDYDWSNPEPTPNTFSVVEPLAIQPQSNVEEDELASVEGVEYVTSVLSSNLSGAYGLRLDAPRRGAAIEDAPVGVLETGGDEIQIIGHGFRQIVNVWFGPSGAEFSTETFRQAQSVDVVSDREVLVTVPARPSGIAVDDPVDVVVEYTPVGAAKVDTFARIVDGIRYEPVDPRPDRDLLPILLGLGAALLGLFAADDDPSSGGPCFIATAAYGTPMADEITVLRTLRDTVLLETSVGTAVVDAYYRVSPPLADVIASSPVLASLVRILLAPVVLLAKAVVALPHVSMALFMVLSAMTMLRMRRNDRKAHKA